jgi:hypothetical protein
MFRTARTRIALAAAALAIVATSFAPAVSTFASPLTPSQESSYATPKPDLVAELQAFMPHAGEDDYLVTGWFDNIGGPIGAITAKGECSDLNGKHTVVYMQMFEPWPANTTGPVIQYVCPAGSNGARLTVSTQNDANTKNNVAKIGVFF